VKLEEFVARGQAAQNAADQIIQAFGVCRICGCTEEDCRLCIEATGEPCSWADDTRTICSRCAPSVQADTLSGQVRGPGSTPGARSSLPVWSLDLITSSDGSKAILYVYRNRECVKAAIGRLETLRAFAASEYPAAKLRETTTHGWFEVRPPGERNAA
jgi:hypothetical protein